MVVQVAVAVWQRCACSVLANIIFESCGWLVLISVTVANFVWFLVGWCSSGMEIQSMTLSLAAHGDSVGGERSVAAYNIGSDFMQIQNIFLFHDVLQQEGGGW